MSASRSTGGFTLIEALIAIALGLVVCGIAFAAVRLCAQCTMAANRLSIENRLWRAGCVAALDDFDFWTPYDDAADPSRQPLRAADAPAPAGRTWTTNPFRPMSFDPDFDAAKPKTWWRGTPVCADAAHVGTFGDYSLFSGLGHTDPEHAWLPETLCAIQDRLGSYATLDYLPANTIYQAFVADAASPDRGRSVAEFCECRQPSGDEPNRLPRSNVRHPDFVRARLGYTDCMLFTVTPDPRYRALGVHRSAFGDDIGGGWRSADYHRACATVRPLLAASPAAWPAVQIDERRFAEYNGFTSFATIRMTSPLTGEAMALKFAALATTLRGARQQRGLDTYAVRP